MTVYLASEGDEALDMSPHPNRGGKATSFLVRGWPNSGARESIEMGLDVVAERASKVWLASIHQNAEKYFPRARRYNGSLLPIVR
jgi:hypothetical protein